MRKLITEVIKFTLPLALTITCFISVAGAGEVICGNYKSNLKRTYPVNATAIKLASELGVKTCTGTSSTRFKDAVKSQGHTGKFVVISKADLKAAKGKLAALGGGNGPSW